MPRGALFAIVAIGILVFPACTFRSPPEPPSDRASEYSGAPLVDRLLSADQLAAIGWTMVEVDPDESSDPGSPGTIRCNGDFGPAFADGILRLRARVTALGPLDDRGAHKQEELVMTALSDVDEATFGRLAFAVRGCDGERSSQGDDLWSPATHFTEMTENLPPYSVGFELVISDLDTSRRQWTVIAHGEDDTLLFVTTSSSDTDDSFRPELVQAAVDEFRGVDQE